MTYPEGRQPLGADDMAKMHPSTWEAEAKALRARVQELEDGLGRIIALCDACPGVADGAAEIARAALQKQYATTAPHSATHSAKSDPGKGTTPETP